ncbi:unnamed protein product [Rotaria sordida]|uniref:Uncharacterized protein n=1 Tax=Rotaria sordida TaxID=392033 RepID=A0A813YN04_9BILA|nr:unnamed protein product [Rotaria sordida]CAF1105294.1 unnamed protein product [Rotaria sordida]CAF3648019.1 unnamed protein product [Rotaria sordida]CAF3751362.1 unnamed protein product [Rotaria sordida]
MAVFAIIFICNAQDDPIEIEKPQIPPLEIPPIIIHSNNFCLAFPSITSYIANGGTCKINRYYRSYRCSNEHQSCCPTETSPSAIISLSPVNVPLCSQTYSTHTQCKDYQKCCENC